MGSEEDTGLRPHVLCIGGEDHALRIPFLLALRERGFRVSAASSDQPTPFLRAGIDFHSIHFARFIKPLSDWSALTSVSRLIANVRPGLVQSFDTKPDVLVPLAAKAFRDVRVVSTINGLGWLYSSRSALALGLRPIYRALQRLADRSTSMTVFQNRDDQAFFLRHRMVGRARNVVIPGSGIDIERFTKASKNGSSPAELRHKLGLGGAEIVMTVTRLSRQKGIPTLLKAAALVHAERPGVRFVIVGSRESEGPLAIDQAEIDRHAPYVRAIGPRSDVPALLALADVFAFPTELREGIPRALLEAATVGCPIVATRMPGCTDVISDGWSGFLVPPRAPRQLAQKIIELLRERKTAKAMGVRAAEFARTEFNLDITVSRYAALYEQLLNGSVRHGSQRVDDGIGRHRPDYEPSAFGE